MYYGDNGLMLKFKNFIGAYMNCFGDNYRDPNKTDYDELEKCVKNLKLSLEVADRKLKEFGF